MKSISIFIIICALFFHIDAIGQSDMIDKGFSVKVSFGFPTEAYGYDGVFPISSDISLSSTYGLEVGNQWYFLEENQFGLGLDVNWIDLVYGQTNASDPDWGSIKRRTGEISFLEFGPIATFAINDWIALDGYYNLRPSYMITQFYETSDDYVLMYDFSFFHALGIGVRLKVFYIGYEYTMGSLKGKLEADGEYSDVPDEYSAQKMGANSSNLIIGLQF